MAFHGDRRTVDRDRDGEVRQLSSRLVRRPPRRPAPEFPSGEVILDPPPEAPQPGGRGWQRLVTIAPMGAGAAAMGLMMGTQRGGPLAYVAGGMYGVSIVGMIAAQMAAGGGQTKKEMAEARRQYMRRLAQLRVQVRRAIAGQRAAMVYRHPDPDSLWSTAAGARLWERRAHDGDFGVVRIGRGPQELATPLIPPDTRPVDELEPLCASALRRFVTTYSVVPDLPVAMALRGFARVYVHGQGGRGAALARALVAQYVTFHAPEDAVVAVCVSDARRPDWEWTKWLPHAQHATQTDAVGPLRLLATSMSGLTAMIDDVVATRPRFSPSAQPADGPHVLVVVDGGDTGGSSDLLIEGGVHGVTVLDLSTPAPRLLDAATLVLSVADDGVLSSRTVDGEAAIGPADGLSLTEAEVLARKLAPLRLSVANTGEQPLSGELGLADLLELGDPYEIDITRAWAARSSRDRLRVPIGVGPDGRPVELDLKESAQDGMGPHGLLVGATGSGKSELLRTLVLALAVTHSSETLNFVLVDFKGGATFTKLDRLAHTSAVITNLEGELALVDRMLDAISGELVRRQELLRASGGYASQRDYERARAAGVPLAPLPSLLIVCDEFSELLAAKPDFIDMFLQIGRVGRSLGVHLLLASQRLEEGRLRGLDTHLSYRIGLRTFSSMESRTVLGVPDAYELPRSPGHGYLKTGVEGLTRFKAAYVSGVHRRGTVARGADGAVRGVREYATGYQAPAADPALPAAQTASAEDDVLGETLLDIVLDRLVGHGPPAHQVWLPPLTTSPTLGELLPPLVVLPGGAATARGLTTADPALHGRLRTVVGVIDKPFEQRLDPLWLDLSGAAGHVIVAGGPQTGKSTVLRTLVAGLALTHTPAELQVYGLDLSGGLAALGELPHVGGIAASRDADSVRRTVAEVQTLLAEREQRFSALGVDEMASYRRLRQQGRVDDPFGDVLLVIDGWSTLRSTYEDLEPAVADLAARGLGYGIHLAVSCARWMEVRPAIRDMFGTRLELRLGDPADSMVNRRAAINVPENAPGRGLGPDGLHLLTCLPRADGRHDRDTAREGLAKLAQAIGNEWPGPPAPRVRLLPARLPYESLPGPERSAPHQRSRLPIGIAESDLGPVFLDPASEAHFLLLGDAECGKSTFLRALARSVVERYRPDEARIILIDYRRSLLGSVPESHLIGYGTATDVTSDLVRQVTTVMTERRPGPSITAAQLRDRSWWSGPELFLLVDDYDLVAGQAGNPLLPLIDHLAHGRDTGLHMVVTRRAGGAARAMFDPLLGRIRELGSPGMLMSGPRDEGPLLGTRKPQLLPPGRGWLVTRREGERLVQLGWLPPQE
jgi:S-DNA-T family DNA segregation ATPase FtsK/SpoIIIE